MPSLLTLSVVAAVAAVASIPGCSTPADGSILPFVVGTRVTPSQEPFTRLFASATSGFTEPAAVVLRDEAALSAVWRTIFEGTPLVPVPTVDFAQKMVVLLALGPRNADGYTIHFDSMTVQAGMAVIGYTVNTPGLDCIPSQVVTSPVELVVVPRVDGRARFDATTLLKQC